MDIDEQIRDILMKSTPINDNSAQKNLRFLPLFHKILVLASSAIKIL